MSGGLVDLRAMSWSEGSVVLVEHSMVNTWDVTLNHSVVWGHVVLLHDLMVRVVLHNLVMWVVLLHFMVSINMVHISMVRHVVSVKDPTMVSLDVKWDEVLEVLTVVGWHEGNMGVVVWQEGVVSWVPLIEVVVGEEGSHWDFIVLNVVAMVSWGVVDSNGIWLWSVSDGVVRHLSVTLLNDALEDSLLMLALKILPFLMCWHSGVGLTLTGVKLVVMERLMVCQVLFVVWHAILVVVVVSQGVGVVVVSSLVVWSGVVGGVGHWGVLTLSDVLDGWVVGDEVLSLALVGKVLDLSSVGVMVPSPVGVSVGELADMASVEQGRVHVVLLLWYWWWLVVWVGLLEVVARLWLGLNVLTLWSGIEIGLWSECVVVLWILVWADVVKLWPYSGEMWILIIIMVIIIPEVVTWHVVSKVVDILVKIVGVLEGVAVPLILSPVASWWVLAHWRVLGDWVCHGFLEVVGKSCILGGGS